MKELHALKPLPHEQIVLAQQNILTLVMPGTHGKSLQGQNLTHSVEFLQKKKIEGYTWNYKNIEVAGAQLTKVAKKLWESCKYTPTKETISIHNGRTVDIWLYPVEYAKKALDILVENGKIILPSASKSM